MNIYIWFPFILLLASFVQSFTGFGLALISVASLSLIVDPKISVPLAGIYGWIVTFPIVARTYTHVKKHDIIFLVIGSLPGTFLGAWILRVLDKDIILLMMGTVLVIFGGYFFIKKPRAKDIDDSTSPAWQSTIIGFLSGSLGASVGEPGPPVIAYLTGKHWSAQRVKATLSLFFMIQMVGALIGFFINGLISLELLDGFLWALPGFVLGTCIGLILFEKSLSSRINYHKIVDAFLVLIGMRLVIEHIGIIKNLF